MLIFVSLTYGWTVCNVLIKGDENIKFIFSFSVILYINKSSLKSINIGLKSQLF